MSSKITIHQVIDDIQFELLQGSVRQDEVGDAIQSVWKHQNQLRTKLLAKLKGEARDVTAQQFQLNDMMLTLLQEMANELRAVRHEQRQIHEWFQQRDLPVPSSRKVDTSSLADAASEQNSMQMESKGPLASGDNGSPSVSINSSADVYSAMARNALDVPIHTRPVNIPVIGFLLQKMRATFHSLVIYYITRLAQRQGDVNQIYGTHILVLMQENAHLRQEIAAIHNQLNSSKQTSTEE